MPIGLPRSHKRISTSPGLTVGGAWLIVATLAACGSTAGGPPGAGGPSGSEQPDSGATPGHDGGGVNPTGSDGGVGGANGDAGGGFGHDAGPPHIDAGGGGPGGTDSGGLPSSPDAGGGTGVDAAIPPPTGAVFYVATTGNDSNPGTLASPWKTVKHAMTTVTAGATVQVRAGVYSEQVEVGVSGAAGSPITLESYPGELGILDGTGVAVVNGAGLLTIDGKSHLVIRGLEIRNYTTTTSAVVAGIYVQGAAVDVQLLNNHVHNIVTTVGSCNGNGGNAFGVAIYGNSATPISQLLIHGNELDSLQTGCSESMTVNGNVDGFEVSNNVVHDNNNIGIDAIGFEGTAPSGSLDYARNGIIRKNTVYNITSKSNPAYSGDTSADGIYVDGGHNILIEENTVHNVDIGIEVTSEHSGQAASYVVVRNNLVYYSNLTGISIGGYDSQRGGTDHSAFLNNTLYENITEFSVQFYVSTDLFEDNVLYNSSGTYESGATTGVTLDHNVQLQTGAANVFVTPGTPPTGTVPVDLHIAAGTQSQTKGQGTVVTCPSGWTCPAIWGAPLNGTTDFAESPRQSGNAIDIGAFQAL